MLASTQESADFVALFVEHGVRQTYRKGDFVIHPGDTPPGVFYIESGLVKAYDITKYDEENLLIIRKSGELFPLIWGITGQERSIIYQALAPTTTYRISRQRFVNYMKSRPESLAPILDMTLEMYRLHSERILNLEYRTVRERIISFLLTMSQRFGLPVEDGILIEAPLRQQDIASSVNATRETTSRELSALEKKGWIDSRHAQIILKDVAALQKSLS